MTDAIRETGDVVCFPGKAYHSSIARAIFIDEQFMKVQELL